MQHRRPSVALLCLPVLALLAGCITPPAVLSGGTDHVPFDELPPDAESVAVVVGEDSQLRGIFVPSDPGAPVVLHLLESGGSATHGTRGIGAYPYLERLADRGFASLILDYRGVGMSDGDRSPHHLREDALAAWDEAVRRAGSPSRVVVRGMSIGALAAASLLEDGVEPGAVILIAPVRAETVAGHFARASYGGFLGGAISLFLGDAGDSDLVAAIEMCPSPLLVLAAASDDALPADERALVEVSVASVGGRFELISNETHLGLILRTNELDALELAFLQARFPGLPPEQRQSAVPRDAEGIERVDAFVRRRRTGRALALAAGRPDFPQEPWDEELLVRWWRDLTWSRDVAFTPEQEDALLTFSDPSGVALDPRELPTLRRFATQVREGLTDDGPAFVESLLAVARERDIGEHAYYDRRPPGGVFDPLLQLIEGLAEANRGAADNPDDAPQRMRLSERASFRVGLRLLLKAAGIPERVRGDAASGWLVEVDVGDGWNPLDLDITR